MSEDLQATRRFEPIRDADTAVTASKKPASRMDRLHKKAVPTADETRSRKSPAELASQPKTATEKTELTSQDKMIRGTAWLTAGNIFSRLLGAVYVIPWYMWMGSNGDSANALYSKGYNIYALFLMISTAGIPSAVSKQTARYNTLQEYGLSRRLLHYTLRIMLIGGLFFTAVMFFGAPILAQGHQDLIPVMRSLSLVLLIFPCMSVIRGFFQGNSEMMPYAISQIIEQIARVAYMLGSCFLIMKVMKGDYTTAVVHSTFAAFVGVIFAMGVLLYFFLRQRPYFKAREAESLNQLQFSGRDLVIQMIKEAVPFIIVGSGTSIFKIIDQYTFEPIMGHLTSASAESLERLFALFAANPDKLTMVVISIATSLASASLPLITEKYTRRDQKGLSELIANNLQLFFFVMLPATVGMIIVAFPMNTLFYKADHMGTALLVQACLTGIMMGLFMMASSTLQGLNGNRSAIFFLGIGLLVKILTQFPLIFFFHAFGPLLASLLGYLASCLYLLERIYRISRFPLKKTLHGIAEIIFLTAGMAVAAILALKVGSLFLSPDRKAQSFMLVMFVAVIGGGFYLYLSLRTRIADRLMGAKAQGIRRRLHIR